MTTALYATENLTAIHDILEDWLLSRSEVGRTPKTVAIYRWTMETFIKRTGAQSLGDINAASVRRYLYHLREERKNSGATVVAFYRTLRAFIGWARRARYPVDPSLLSEGFWGSKWFALEAPKHDDPPKAIFTPLELSRVLQFSKDGRYGLFLKLLAGTGLRLNEALSLTAADVIGLDTRGRDDAPAMLLLRKTKGRKPRTVPLTLALYRPLQRLALRRPQGPLFDLTENGVGHYCIWLSKKLGIHVNPHKFRHTFGTQLMQATRDPERVRQIMGHADYKTMQTYMHAEGLQLGVGWERLLG